MKTKNFFELGALFLVAALLITTDATAQTCGRQKNEAEKLVCQTKSVLALDVKLQSTYDAYIDLASDRDALAIREVQRMWLSTIRDRCTDIVCLEAAYKIRTRALQGQILKRYQDQEAEPLIAMTKVKRGIVSDILTLERKASAESFHASYGASVAADIFFTVHSSPFGGVLVGLYSHALEGVSVRYWNPEINVEWIPNISTPLDSGDLDSRLDALKSFNSEISVGVGKMKNQKFTASNVECPLKNTSRRGVFRPSCGSSQNIRLTDASTLQILSIYEGGTCLDSFGQSAYFLSPGGGSPVVARTPLLLMKKSVSSLFGGRSYCEYDSTIGSVREIKLPHRVLEPQLPSWTGPLGDGSALILGAVPPPHSRIKYFYRLINGGFAPFNDKRMKLAWIDTDWLITNGYLMGKSGSLSTRVQAMDKYLQDHLGEK